MLTLTTALHSSSSPDWILPATSTLGLLFPTVPSPTPAAAQAPEVTFCQGHSTEPCRPCKVQPQGMRFTGTLLLDNPVAVQSVLLLTLCQAIWDFSLVFAPNSDLTLISQKCLLHRVKDQRVKKAVLQTGREKVSRAADLSGRGRALEPPRQAVCQLYRLLLSPPSSPNTSFSPPFPGTGSRYLSHSRGSHCIFPYRREVRRLWVSSSFPLRSNTPHTPPLPPLHLLSKCPTEVLPVPYRMWVAGNDSNCRERKSSRCFS